MTLLVTSALLAPGWVRRVHAVLARSDDPPVAGASLWLVRKLVRENDLVACQPRDYKVTTIRGDFTATAPGCKLVGDITYAAQLRVMYRSTL